MSALLVALTLVGACGVSATTQGQASGRSRPARAPLTDLDPAPYHPQPSASSAVGGVGALAVSSHVDTAIRTALEFVAAVRDGDATRIRGLLADDLFLIGERDFYRPTTAQVVLRTLGRAAPGTPTVAQPAPLTRLLVVQSAEVGPPRATSTEGRRFLPSDTLVSFPVTPEGRAELARWYPAWRSQVRILVRTAGEPRVIGF